KIALRHTAIDEADRQALGTIRKGIDFGGLNTQQFARLLLLITLPVESKDVYLQKISHLYHAADLNELAALYKALPFLAFSDAWVQRCAERIRSNMGPVLEAVMYHNPYPAENLDENAWNQMILKAFFTDKDINL